MNKKFQSVLQQKATATPPIWMMRQAGRYHSHYQKLRAQHSFMDLCKIPELAAQVALGPIQDFDFDVAILFSDLLFPLEALGMGLEYTDAGPRLGWHLTPENLKNLAKPADALEHLLFQKQAVKLTREILPADKSLIGFVGGPWTLFVYACEGSHAGALTQSKIMLPLYTEYLKTMLPLLKENIRLQLEGGAEVIYLFDTAAGEISPALYRSLIEPGLIDLARQFPQKLAYYSKGTQGAYFSSPMNQAPWVGLGFDHRWNLPELLANKKFPGFVQGNFDQSLLHADFDFFKKELANYLQPFKDLPTSVRQAWVCGLGHGVLPKTPEKHVKYFVDHVREVFS